MITEDYVSFETAKLLKEKGFDAKCNKCYAYFADDDIRFLNLKYPKSAQLLIENRYPCVTLQMAMKWLREVHNINISVVPHSHKEGKPFDYEFVYWNGVKYHIPYNEKHPTYHELFGRTWKKHEQACETAIKYCLENLI